MNGTPKPKSEISTDPAQGTDNAKLPYTKLPYGYFEDQYETGWPFDY